MTDTALKNPIVTAVLAVKNGEDVVAVSSSSPIPITNPTSDGTQGTGSSYNPPTGGSGVFGWLSGIYKEIKAGISVSYVIASDGVLLPADSLETTIAGSTATAITYTVTYLTFTYVKTFTYKAGSVSSISQWVKQQ
jgi:hypothetical protein